MAKPKALLFGREIVPSGRLTLTEQIHDALCQEIHGGRWKVGDRLPSISDLARECGMSRQPVQAAFEALREEGYVRLEHGNGTFLASMLPKGREPLGAIGVLLFPHEKDNPKGWALHETDQWRLHAILREAAERHYTEEIRYLPSRCDPASVDLVGGMFSERVKGIISLQDFKYSQPETLPPDRIPLVFLGYHRFLHGPCVSLDLEEGFYRLTQEAIARGHRRIALCGSQFGNRAEGAHVLAGHQRAMKEADLPFLENAYRASLRFDASQLPLFRGFLEAFVAPDASSPAEAVTAVICARSQDAMGMIAVADLMGIQVPEDLSVVSLLTAPMRLWNTDQRLTGMEYNLEHTVRVCFDLLTEQMRSRTSLISLVRVRPVIRQGDSLAPPRQERAASG